MVNSAGDACQALTHWTDDGHTGYASLLMPWGRHDWLTLRNLTKPLFSGLIDGRVSCWLVGKWHRRQRWHQQPGGLGARKEGKCVLISGTPSTLPWLFVVQEEATWGTSSLGKSSSLSSRSQVIRVRCSSNYFYPPSALLGIWDKKRQLVYCPLSYLGMDTTFQVKHLKKQCHLYDPVPRHTTLTGIVQWREGSLLLGPF